MKYLRQANTYVARRYLANSVFSCCLQIHVKCGFTGFKLKWAFRQLLMKAIKYILKLEKSTSLHNVSS
jgi:hypothetical protein